MKFNHSQCTPTAMFKDLALGEVFTLPHNINKPAIKTGNTESIFYTTDGWKFFPMNPEANVIYYPASELILHEPCYTM